MTAPNNGSNLARLKAVEHFEAVLRKADGNAGMSESRFASEYLARVQGDDELYADGWYSPPPGGVAVLFGTSVKSTRISFGSLRQRQWWPSEIVANWDDLFMYFYTSTCSTWGGPIGDFAVTLYRGDDIRIKDHYLKCLEATGRVLQAAITCGSSVELFTASNKIFSKCGVRNAVVSVSDITPVDLGHTFPEVQPSSNSKLLSSDERERISKSRRFINSEVDWTFHDGLQFSIEPQLRDISASDLPQISFHFRMSAVSGRILVDPDVYRLLDRWMGCRYGS